MSDAVGGDATLRLVGGYKHFLACSRISTRFHVMFARGRRIGSLNIYCLHLIF